MDMSEMGQQSYHEQSQFEDSRLSLKAAESQTEYL